MKFVEESEGAFSAAQLAAAERELEEQKKEWELDRLRALREEEERRMRLADDDEKPLTFGREDAQNQVNSASNSKKLVNKKLPPNRRRNSRKNISKSAQESESETETTTESESESQEDVVEDSLDEESSHTESQSQGDEDEEEEEAHDQNDSEKGGYPKRKNRSNKSFSQNHFDLNSPRTRSRGNVKINLWTLDVSPILPGIKPKCRGRASNLRKQRELEMRMKAEESFILPLPPVSSPKKLNNTNISNKSNEEDNTVNEKEVVTADLKHTDAEKSTILPADEKRSESIENCKVIVNHCTIATSSPKSDCDKTVIDESNATIPLDSLQIETCSQSGNSSAMSEQSKDLEEGIIDNKDGGEAAQELTENTTSSIYITKLMSIAMAQSSNLEGAVSCNDDSEYSNVNLISQNSSPRSVVTESNIKRISDSKCLKSSMTLEIDEEINISEDSLIAPLKNKIVVQDTDENAESTTKKLASDTVSKSKITSSTIDESDTGLKGEELLISNAESKVLKNKAADQLQDINISNDEYSVKNDARAQSPIETKEDMDMKETSTNNKQYDESTSNSDTTNKSVNDNESISVIESSSSQEPSSSKQEENYTKLDECVRDEDDTKVQSTSSTQNSDNTFPFDTLGSAESSGSESNTENKIKFRKPDTISYGVTTRSAKVNISVENTENKNLILCSDTCESQGSEISNSNSNTHRKETSKVQIRRPDTPRPTIEHSRITRSSAIRSLTPPPNSNSTKSLQKRRPDTPLPECFRSSRRLATRSMSNLSSSLRNEEQNTASYEKPMTRRSKTLDNGVLNPTVFRRSSSIPPMKPTSDSKDCTSSISTRCKRNSESTSTNTSTPRRRPDTPVPTFEQGSRVTRSGLNFTLNSAKGPNHVSNKGNKHIRKIDSSSDSKSQEEESSAVSPLSGKTETLNTDSNGNAVVSETFPKQDDSTLSSFNEINEKPQRTAKVVAILTLDTRSNHTSKASSSVHTKTSNCNSSDTKNNKKNADSNSNSASDSSGKNCVLRISDVTPNCKVDGWCDSGLDTGSRDRVSSNVFSNVASTYTSSNKAGKSPTLSKNTSLNSKLKTDKVPIQSTVIALVDLDNDSNYDSSDGSKKLRRKIKRTRLSSVAKPLISGKTNESQIADALDEEEQIPPMKKSIRTQLTPPPPSQTTQLEKLSSGTIS